MKDFEEMLMDLMLKESLAEQLGNLWELQAELREIEKGIIKGTVTSLEMNVSLTVGKLKEKETKETKVDVRRDLS